MGHYQEDRLPIETQAIAGFLDNIDFRYFCTFTTRKPISIASTRRIAETVVSFVDGGNTSTVFWAAEPFDVREGYHFHALMRTPKDKLEIFDWYFRRYGRCSILDNSEPDRRQAASYYCSKYLTKKLADYDIHFETALKNRQQTAINFPFNPSGKQ